MFLYETAELFTDTRQNTVFTSVGSHLFDISGSTRGARLNSFVGRLDSLSVSTRSGKTRVKGNLFSLLQM